MAKANVPLISFNRGLVDKTVLARVDIERLRLSAEVMTNWLPKTQGEMKLRPGTKYLGSSRNDSGAQFLEFVASTADTALIELTQNVMRVWDDDVLVTSDSGVGTDFTVDQDTGGGAGTPNDTGGWTAVNIGGGGVESASAEDQIPAMTGATTAGVTISESSVTSSNFGWKVGDNTTGIWKSDNVGSPHYVTVDFGTGANKKVDTLTLKASTNPGRAPSTFALQYNSTNDTADTGTWTNALIAGRTDTGGVDYAAQTSWASNEIRTFQNQGNGYAQQTGGNQRFWRVYVDAVDNAGTTAEINEIELIPAASESDTGQTIINSPTSVTLNARAIGSTARARKAIDVSDTGEEHSLYVDIGRGPVAIRVGSTAGDDDYIAQTDLLTGYHNFKFTPNTTRFYVDLLTTETVDRIVSEIRMGDTGTLELVTPWGDTGGHNLENIRYDQSADVVFVDCKGVHPRQIERRGTGRSWSIVRPDFRTGPFRTTQRSNAKLTPSATRGNITIASDIPFFKEGHVGSLIRITHEGQSGVWYLGAKEAVTDAIEVTGISDTGFGGGGGGSANTSSERKISFNVSGRYEGQITIERSFDSADYGFKTLTSDFVTSGNAVDTGTFATTVVDEDDNVKVWYRARMSESTDTGGASGGGFGAAIVKITYPGGITDGIARITSYTTNTSVNAEVLSRFADTGTPKASDDWAEQAWSGVHGYPTSTVLHEGRLFHAGGANIWGSASDDYTNFDDTIEGDAAPISRTFGSGPVDDIFYLVSLLRLVAGTAGSEIAIKASSLDEPLTPSNASAKAFSTQGSANIRALKIDQHAMFVQRSKQRAYLIGFGNEGGGSYDYESRELTILVPTLLQQGVVSMAVQRQPDTRIHCVLADGKVAILTYEPHEEVLAWSLWAGDTGTGATVERAMVLPGENEDQVYYHIRRTIADSGTTPNTKRYLEKWALESEAKGDTGLTFLMDCAASNTDAGLPTSVPGFSHLQGEQIVAVANDTGQSNSYMKDLSRDTGTTPAQVTHYVNKKTDTGDTGKISVDTGLKHVVGGLPYVADYKSAKLAYAAQGGTALTQHKRVGRLGLIMFDAHNRGLLYGSDTGHLDPLPRVLDNGAEVDPDKIFDAFDEISIAFNSDWDTDARVHLRAKSPRPVTVAALIPLVDTNDKL